MSGSLLCARAQPTITQPPTNKTAYVGLPVSWSAAATGGEGLAYEWRFARAGQVPQVISPWSEVALLSLPAIAPDHAGRYWLVVQDAAGSVTNPPVHLRVLDTKVRTNIGFQVTVYNGISDTIHELQGSWDLRNWTSIVRDTNAAQSTVLHRPPADHGFYFYRVLPLP